MANLPEIRPATEPEVGKVQYLEDKVWKEGAYKFYKELHGIYPEGILVAVAAERFRMTDDTLLGYVAVEKLHRSDLGANMPPWSHDPELSHKSEGGVWYILNHTVSKDVESRELTRPEVSNHILKGLVERAKNSADISTIAVIYWLEHNKVADPSKLWGRHGFRELPETMDPSWGPYPGKEGTGAVIWALDVK